MKKQKKIKKPKKELSYRGISCDSEQEIFILMWLFELQDNGILWEIDRSESFLLSEPLIEKEVIQLKTKTKEKDKTILHKHIYTPEFRVKIYNFFRGDTLEGIKQSKIAGAFDKLFRDYCRVTETIEDTGMYYYFEVKPEWDQNNMTRLFKINQKWMYDKYKIFVNLVKPLELFEQTFTPKEYLKTTTGKARKINFKVRTFEEWIKTL